MFMEKGLHFLLVDITHLLWGHGNNIAILVASLRGELVDVLFIGEVVIKNA
jgi:hypothetical protein